MAWNVVIAGGGFGGFYTARTLERVLPSQSARVTLVSEDNFMLYTPLLPGAAAGTLEPRHVVVPLREELRRTDLQLGRVVGADPGAQPSCGSGARTGRPRSCATTSSSSRSDRSRACCRSPAWPSTASGSARSRRRSRCATACCARSRSPRRSTTRPQRRAWLTYVFVGAGYAGLEGLAELQDFAADVIELYPRCRTEGMRWILVEARDRVMPEISPSLAGVRDR